MRKKQISVFLAMFIFFVMPLHTVCAERTEFASKVYELEKSLGSYYDVLEFESAARQAAPKAEEDGASFLSDIADSYSARCDTVMRFSKFPDMTQDDYWRLREAAVLAERPFYDAYKDMCESLPGERHALLGKAYIDALSQQYDAVDGYAQILNLPAEEKAKREESLAGLYDDGGQRRRSVLLEMCAVCGLDVDMKYLGDGVDFEALIASAKESAPDQEVVKSVQHALNELGFSAGSEDGLVGKNTVYAVYEYQRQAGMDTDGAIDDELLESLGLK